jgi:hypothetical protein
MTRLPAVVEVAGSVPAADFMVAACAPLSSGAAPFMPDASADTGSPDADMGIGARLLARRLPEGFTAMRRTAARGEERPMAWVRQR